MKRLFFGTLLLLGFLKAEGQASLGFANNSTPGLADTIIMNSSITYGVYVQNTGTQTFNGSFTVYMGVEDTAALFPNLVDSVMVTTSLLAGDTALVTITHNVDPLKFVDGNNTVVIWPAAPGYQTTDTIFKDVYVIEFNAMDEMALIDLNLYPNPVNGILFIKGNFELESVRIMSLDGREILSAKNKQIDLSNFATGIYVVEVKAENGKVMRKKILVE
jgi:hypothetical protein